MSQGEKIVSELTGLIAQGAFWGVLGALLVRDVVRWAVSAFQITHRKRN